MGLVHHKTLVCLSDGHTCLPEYRHSVDAFGSTMQSYVPCILDKQFMVHFMYEGPKGAPFVDEKLIIRCHLEQNGRYSGNLTIPVLNTEDNPSQPSRSIGTIAAVRTGPTSMKILKFKLPRTQPEQPKFGKLIAKISYEFQLSNGRVLPLPDVCETEHIFYYATEDVMKRCGVLLSKKKDLSHFTIPPLPPDIWEVIEKSVKHAKKREHERAKAEKKKREAIEAYKAPTKFAAGSALGNSADAEVGAGAGSRAGSALSGITMVAVESKPVEDDAGSKLIEDGRVAGGTGDGNVGTE